MIRCRRRYDIVPFVESVVEDDLFFESVGEGVKYFSSGPVHFVDNLGKYLQTLFRHSVGSPAAGVCHRVEWCPAPGACYLGEEPVLDGVELGTVRRVVHDKDFHPDTVCETHQVLLDDAMAAGVGATAVTENHKHTGFRIEGLEVAVPHTFDVVADKLGGVVAGADREVAGVAGDVVDAVRHNHSAGEGLEVMVVDLGRRCAVNPSVAFEVPDHLLLFGVHADDGYPGLDAGVFRGAYLHKLRIPVLRLAQRQALEEGPALEPCGLEHLPYYVAGHVVPLPKEFAPDLRHGEADPHDALVLRKTRHETGNNPLKRRHPFGVLVEFPFRSAARHALPAIWRGNVVADFKNRLGNGVRRTVKSLGHSLYRTACGARRLACNKMPSVAFFECAEIIHFRLANLYWRFLLHRCNGLEINYKDTKISPVILYLKC